MIPLNGAIRPLEPKAFRPLLFLVENARRAFSKEENPGDDWKVRRFIETIPVIGYRFLAQPDPPESVTVVPAAPSRRPALFLAGIRK